MAVWKRLSYEGTSEDIREEGYWADDEVHALVDRLDQDPQNADLRLDLGMALYDTGRAELRGWILEFELRSVCVLDRERAGEWLAARGLPVPAAKNAKRLLKKEILRYLADNRVGVDSADWPPDDVFELFVTWTARPKR